MWPAVAERQRYKSRKQNGDALSRAKLRPSGMGRGGPFNLTKHRQQKVTKKPHNRTVHVPFAQIESERPPTARDASHPSDSGARAALNHLAAAK